MRARIDFCGELYDVSPEKPVTVGRDADVVVDEDNQFLHRRFLTVSSASGLIWIENVGSQVAATLADEQGLVQTWLAPGAKVPVVFPRSVVYFTAGPTTYDLDIVVDEPPFVPTPPAGATSNSTTIGRVAFTSDQKLLCLALAEDMLRRGVHGRGSIPPSAQAAERLGWTITKFNRKLDNVCEKLAKMGVRGLTSSAGTPASARRARLVEYVLASRLVTDADLAALDAARVD